MKKELTILQLKKLLELNTIHISKLIRSFAMFEIDYEHSDSFKGAIQECTNLVTQLNYKGVNTSKFDWLKHFNNLKPMEFK